MKQASKFQKAIAFIMATVMLASLAVVAIPIGAAETTGYTEITPNTDFVYNGITYRFDVREGNTDSYARINADGSIEFKYAYGDILWFPDVQATNASAIHAEVTAIAHDNDKTGMGNVFQGIVYGATEKSDGSFANGIGGILRTAARARITVLSREDLVARASDGSGYGNGGGTKIYNDSGNFKSEANYACIKNGNNDWAFNATISFDMSRVGNDVTFSMGSVDGAFFTHTYNSESYAYAGAVGFTNVWSDNNYMGYKTLRFDKLTLTNCTVNGEAKDTYTVLEKQGRPLELLKSTIEFDGGYAFVNFDFSVVESYVATASVVVKVNDTEVARKKISELTAVDGKYAESIHFAYGDGSVATDTLSFYLEDGGAIVAFTTATVMIGEQYERFINSPPTVPTSEYLKYAIYVEDFSESIVLVPGENIVNGHKWTYIKNSEDGSAEIKNGRLYFTGSKNDMLLFDDINLDKASYKFTYDVTYMDTPADDIWDNWDCWFGGLFHLADEADPVGNRNAVIAAVTPDDVHMMQGKVNVSGVFTEDEALSSHTPFLTSGVYWNGRLGNGVPATIYNYFGIDSGDNGGLYVSGYNGSSHQLAANLPGSGALSNDVRVGRIGFVCSESKVSVIVDNIEILTQGKKIMVDGEEMQIAGNGFVDISALEADDTKLVYANVDGTPKYAGEVIVANRLTSINTVQIAPSTNKAVADGQTGLKWVTQISKADYEKLTSDSNISKVEVGTVMVATAIAKDGITVANATSNIAGTATVSGDNYVFEGVLPIAKDARDTSYSGVGYVKVTMKDGKEVVVYADYIARLHAYALSDLVETFVDDDPTTTPGGNTDTDPTETTEPTTNAGNTATNEKKGCGSVVLGSGAIMLIAVLGGACLMTKKNRYE